MTRPLSKADARAQAKAEARARTDASGAPALELRNLTMAFPGEEGPIPVVRDVSLQVHPGETLAVVGESGSGKTMTFLSALGLLPAQGKVTGGQALLGGRDLLAMSDEARRQCRGTGVSMVFQDPLTGLNPVFTIGEQLAEVLRAHRRVTRAEARARAVALLERVQIPDASRRVDDYPHQLSGGMRQRVLIAMAIALEPDVLIADEPTTALDVTVQAQVLELLADLRDASRMALVLITHDLGLVARHADRVAVMYGGRVIESGPVEAIFEDTAHPYTVALFRSVPDLEGDTGRDLTPIEGQPPNPIAMPAGCAFAPRCYLGRGRARCETERPALATVAPDHASACWFPDEARASRRQP